MAREGMRPTQSQFASALAALGPRLTDRHRRLLAIHYGCPERKATARQLAQKLGYKSFSGANSAYGSLGRLIHPYLEGLPDNWIAGQSNWWRLLAMGDGSESEWAWTLRPELALALEELPWFQSVVREANSSRITGSTNLASAPAPERTVQPNFASCSEQLRSIGFPESTPVATLRTIAHLFGTRKSRCGIYMLRLPGDRAYIGQARDVVRRFAQHLRVHESIEAFAFLPTRLSSLNERERFLIREAERAGIVLSNVLHVTDFVGETDLDAVVSAEIQERWLRDPSPVNTQCDTGARVQLPRAQVERFRPNFKRYAALDESVPAATLALDLYMRGCLPLPRATEYSFWAVSCMPSTNRSTWPRMYCVSAGVMELFVCGYHSGRKPPVASWAFVNVSKKVLYDGFGGQKAFVRQFPNVRLDESRAYRDAGDDQLSLSVADADEMLDLLPDPRLQMAAGALALRVMRKRPTVYSQYHCQLLVDEALGSEERVLDLV